MMNLQNTELLGEARGKGCLLKTKLLCNKTLKNCILLCLASLVLASCATRMKVPKEMEPERLLPADALAYIRITPNAAEELILPLIDDYGIANAADLIDRINSMVIALMPGSAPIPAQAVLYGVAAGKFPRAYITLKLNTDKNWSREGHGWVSQDTGLRLALTSSGQLVVGTASLDTLTSLGYDRKYPIPGVWNSAWHNDLAVFIPDPFLILEASLPLDAESLPLESMVLAAQRQNEAYSLYLGFEFSTDRMAVVFSPLSRLFLFALAKTLWPQEASELLASVVWSTQGPVVEATGLNLTAEQLTSLMSLPLRSGTQTQGEPHGGVQ